MSKLQKVLKIYSIIFIIFALVSFGYSLFADILQRINENINIDKVAETQMLPFVNGAVFIIIGAALQAISGFWGLKSSLDPSSFFKAILSGIITISWQITGFIILFSNYILNIRLTIQIPMTFAFLAITFLARFKSTEGFKKRRLNLSSISQKALGDQKGKRFNIKNLFNVNYRQKKINLSNISLGKNVKRINIRPRRRFK